MGPPPLPSAVGTDGVGPAARRPARLLRRDGRAVRLDGRARARARGRAVRHRRAASTTSTAAALGNTGLGAWLARDLALRDGAGRHGARARRDRRVRVDRRAGRRSCSARAASWRPTAAASGWSACASAAPTPSSRSTRTDDLAGRLPRRRRRRARRHDRHALGRSRRRRDPGRRRATPGTCRSATLAGPEITLPAPALRSVSLDLRGFSRRPSRRPSCAARASSTSRATSRSGDIAVDVEALPLDDVGTAWERQRRAEGRGKLVLVP